MNTSIATLLEQKGGVTHTVPHTVTVAEAVREMNRHKIGSVLVMNGHNLIGIFTERDALSRVIGGERDPLTTPITQVMTADVRMVDPETTVDEVMHIFSTKGCRHLPVMRAGHLHGLISIGDVSRWVASMHRAEAETLRQYIAGDLSG
jgi:CBS domain-containing protein